MLVAELSLDQWNAIESAVATLSLWLTIVGFAAFVGMVFGAVALHRVVQLRSEAATTLNIASGASEYCQKVNARCNDWNGRLDGLHDQLQAIIDNNFARDEKLSEHAAQLATLAKCDLSKPAPKPTKKRSR